MDIKEELNIIAEEAEKQSNYPVASMLRAIIGAMTANHEVALSAHISNYVKDFLIPDLQSNSN